MLLVFTKVSDDWNITENYGLRLFSRIFMTGEQNTLFLKVRIRATPLKQRFVLHPALRFTFTAFVAGTGVGLPCSLSIPHSHACACVSAHSPPAPPPPSLSPPPPSSFFVFLALNPYFRFLLAWDLPLMTHTGQW